MKSQKVAEFLAQLDHPLKEEMVLLRDTIMQVNAQIEEEVKWGGPSFYYKDDIATFSPRVKDAAVLVFHNAEGLTYGSVLEAAPKGKAYAKFKNLNEVELKAKELQAIIKQWIQIQDRP